MSSEGTIRNFDPLERSLACDPTTQLQRVFVYFLQAYFEHPEFKGSGMHFQGNDHEETELIITSEKPRLSALEKTPHISCILGSMQWSQLGHDQMQNTVLSTGARTHTDLIPSTMAYHCQGKEGTHCRRLAWQASWATNAFCRILTRSGGLHRVGRNHSISPESGPTAFVGQLASEELCSVVVQVPFFWQTQWRIRRPAPSFERAEFTLNVRGHVVKPPNVRGRPAYSVPLKEYGERLNTVRLTQKGQV